MCYACVIQGVSYSVCFYTLNGVNSKQTAKSVTDPINDIYMSGLSSTYISIIRVNSLADMPVSTYVSIPKTLDT